MFVYVIKIIKSSIACFKPKKNPYGRTRIQCITNVHNFLQFVYKLTLLAIQIQVDNDHYRKV